MLNYSYFRINTNCDPSQYKFVNMENSRTWEKLVKSGSYNRSLKKYVDIRLPEPEENVLQMESAETMPNDSKPSSKPSREDPSPLDFRNESNNNFNPFVDWDEQQSEPDEVSCSAYDDYYSLDGDSIGYADNCEANLSLNQDSVELDLTAFLQNWSLEHNIPHSALKPLLSRLSQYDRTLPEDPRRLLDTPRNPANIVEIQGGQYWHQVLGKCDHTFK